MDYDFSFDYDGFDRMMAFIALIVFLPCTWYMTLNGVIEWLLGLVIIGTTITITVALVVPCIAALLLVVVGAPFFRAGGKQPPLRA